MSTANHLREAREHLNSAIESLGQVNQNLNAAYLAQPANHNQMITNRRQYDKIIEHMKELRDIQRMLK